LATLHFSPEGLLARSDDLLHVASNRLSSPSVDHERATFFLLQNVLHYSLLSSEKMSGAVGKGMSCSIERPLSLRLCFGLCFEVNLGKWNPLARSMVDYFSLTELLHVFVACVFMYFSESVQHEKVRTLCLKQGLARAKKITRSLSQRGRLNPAVHNCIIRATDRYMCRMSENSESPSCRSLHQNAVHLFVDASAALLVGEEAGSEQETSEQETLVKGGIRACIRFMSSTPGSTPPDKKEVFALVDVIRDRLKENPRLMERLHGIGEQAIRDAGGCSDLLTLAVRALLGPVSASEEKRDYRIIQYLSSVGATGILYSFVKGLVYQVLGTDSGADRAELLTCLVEASDGRITPRLPPLLIKSMMEVVRGQEGEEPHIALQLLCGACERQLSQTGSFSFPQEAPFFGASSPDVPQEEKRRPFCDREAVCALMASSILGLSGGSVPDGVRRHALAATRNMPCSGAPEQTRAYTLSLLTQFVLPSGPHEGMEEKVLSWINTVYMVYSLPKRDALKEFSEILELLGSLKTTCGIPLVGSRKVAFGRGLSRVAEGMSLGRVGSFCSGMYSRVLQGFSSCSEVFGTVYPIQAVWGIRS